MKSRQQMHHSASAQLIGPLHDINESQFGTALGLPRRQSGLPLASKHGNPGKYIADSLTREAASVYFGPSKQPKTHPIPMLHPALRLPLVIVVMFSAFKAKISLTVLGGQSVPYPPHQYHETCHTQLRSGYLYRRKLHYILQ